MKLKKKRITVYYQTDLGQDDLARMFIPSGFKNTHVVLESTPYYDLRAFYLDFRHYNEFNKARKEVIKDEK